MKVAVCEPAATAPLRHLTSSLAGLKGCFTKAENADIFYPHVFQSEGEFDLRLKSVHNDENTKALVIFCTIGSRYKKCSLNVSKNYMIDAKPV